jgi:hypothetical protein
MNGGLIAGVLQNSIWRLYQSNACGQRHQVGTFTVTNVYTDNAIGIINISPDAKDTKYYDHYKAIPNEGFGQIYISLNPSNNTEFTNILKQKLLEKGGIVIADSKEIPKTIDHFILQSII